MRPFVFFKDGQMFALKQIATDAEHAAAIEVILRREGVKFFDADGKKVAVKPLTSHDDIQFFRPCFGG